MLFVKTSVFFQKPYFSQRLPRNLTKKHGKLPQNLLWVHQVQVLFKMARLRLQRCWRGYRARQRCQQRRKALRLLQWLSLVGGFYPPLKLTYHRRIAPENMPLQNRKVVFQPSVFRRELLVSGEGIVVGIFGSSNVQNPDNVGGVFFFWGVWAAK